MPRHEDHYRSLFSQLLNGIAYCKVLSDGPPPHDFVYLEVNEAFEHQTGLKNVVGKKVSEVIPGIREQDPWLLNLYSEVAATGRPQKFERYVETLKAWFSVSVYCPETGYFVAVFDVTTRQGEAAALRESEERLATIAAYVPGMLYTYVLHPDGTNRFLYVGPRCRDILEVDERSIMADSSHFWNRIHPGDLERVRQEDVAANREGRSFSSEFRVVTPSGGVKWVSVVSRPAPSRPGEPAVWNGFILDITERKVAEQDREAAHSQLHRHLTNTPLAVIELDGDYRVRRFGGRAEAMFGWRADEVVGKRIDQVPWVPDDDWPKVRSAMRDMDSGARPNNVIRNRNRRKDGSIIHCEWYNSSLTGPDGKLSSVFSLVQDVTEREEALEALAAAEEKYRSMVTAMSEGVVLHAADGRIIECNGSAERVLGLSRAQMEGRTPVDPNWRSIRPDGRPFPGEEHPAMVSLRTGQPVTGEVMGVQTPGGTLRWLSINAEPLRRAAGEPPQAVVATFVDITQRKADAEDLAASEAKYRGLFASLMDGFVSVDMDGVIREFNEVYRKMLGYSHEELAQITYKDITPERWRPMEERIIAEQVLPRGYSEVYEKEYRRKDGTVFPVELRTFLLKEGDRPVAMWAIVRDVTEVRALQMRLAVAGRMAALGTLVAGIAHEINNPLAVVMGNHAVALESIGKRLEVLRSGAPTDRGSELRLLDQVEEELRDSEAGGWRIQRIVKDLTTMGKPDARRDRVRLSEVISGALRWLPVSMRTAAVIRVEDHGAPVILAAAGQIEQVLVNLVTNAVRASLAGRTAPVRVWIGRGEPGMARLEVIDQGTGIDPAVRSRIFEPFFTTRDVGQGTGLGLAVCHAIVSAHGGTISVESKAGMGSTFRVELPVAPADV
jgi:PAS domain S-box-containing protein